MKRKLTFAALFLCTLMTFAQFSGSGAGTENDPYLILNPIQLNQMRNYLNQSGVYFKLMANIDLTEFLQDENPTQGWQPVGSSSSAAFKGILDGNGKTVSGLWIKRSNTDNVALFGYTNGATIKNIKVTGASIEGKDHTGGLAGTSLSSTFSDCTFTGEVKGASDVGGIVANTGDNTVLSNDVVSVTLSASGNYAGGLIGRNDATTQLSVTNCRLNDSQVIGKNYVGGACGAVLGNHRTANTLTNCFIYSEVIGENYVGGICGYSENYNKTINLTSCGFVGNVSATSYAGGLAGRIKRTSNNGAQNNIIKNSFVVGNVVASTDYVGGLVGFEEGVHSSYPDDYCNISNSYFSGTVSGRNIVGGLVGYNKNGEISKCYTSGSVVGTSNVGGLVGHNDQYSTVKTSVAIHSRISASVENVNRIVGKNDGTIAAVGSTDENKSYNRTIVMLKGAVQEMEDNQMNGTGVKATYVAMGWDFTDTWAIQETECYPYMKTQTAPPVITSDLVSNATTISGKCVDGGTITMEIDGETKKQVSAGHSFSFAVNPLQSGHTVRIGAKVDGKEQSYYTEQVVSYPGKGTEQDPYLVYTADDLTGVYRVGYYKLMNDIDLTEWINTNSPTEGWTGIGRDGSDMSQFDGNGFTISGLWSNSTRDYVGLFSMFSNGTIKNLNVKTAAGKKVKGGNCTGILIGYNTNGRIIDCSVEGDVQGTTNVGGVVGSSKNNELTNLVFDGGVTSSTASACIGGIAGLSENDQITGCYSDAAMTTSGESANMGGIAGKANSHIAESVSKGTLTATGANAQVGGIVGTSQTNGIVEDCFSSAALTSTYAAAGIVSYNYGSVTRSLATGNLSTRNYAAGVVGYNDGTSATVSKSVATCNKIDVTYESQQVQQGGGYGQRIIGGIKNNAPAPEMDNYALKTMQVSVNDVSQKVYDDIMNGTSKTMDELNSQSTYAELGWNFSSIWYMNAGTGLPDLKVNQEKTEQTLALTEIPAMKYGDGTYQLPAKTNEGLTLTWTVGNNKVASISGNVLTIKKAGTTSISATQDGNSDYKAFNKSFTLTVAKAPLTITAQNCSKNVGEENPALTVKYEGFVLNENETVLTTQPTILTGATKDSPIGTYPINVSGAEADNYDITLVDGTLTVVDEWSMNNTLDITDIQVLCGRQIILPVNMNNTENIKDLQFDLTLPAGVSIAKDDQGEFIVEQTGRCAKHMLNVGKLGDANVYRVMLYITSAKTITGNEGAIVNVTLETSEDMTEGEYDVLISNIKLSTPDETKITPADVTCKLTVLNSIPGDANGDGEVDIFDVTSIVNYILGTAGENFVEAAADVNGDGEIDIFDVTKTVNIILGVETPAGSKLRRTMAVSESTVVAAMDGRDMKLTVENADHLYIENFEIQQGETKVAAIQLSNPDAEYRDLQFDLYLPDGISVALDDDEEYLIETGSRCTNKHAASMNYKDGHYVCVLNSTGKSPLTGDSGEVLLLTLTTSDELAVGSCKGYFRNVKLSKVDATGAKYEEFSFDITVKSPEHPVTITADNQTMVYGDDVPALTYKTEGSTLEGTPQLSTTATKTSAVGTYPITVAQGTVTNTPATLVDGTLTITKAPLTITAQSYTIKQGEELPVFGVSYDGFKNTDTRDVLKKQPAAACSATSWSDAGTYDITVNGAEAENYDITYVKGTLTIVEADPFTLTYKVDGETYKTVEVKYGATITPETAPTKEGYTFSGWSEIPETMPANDVTITGSFTLIDAIEDVIADDGTYQIYTIDGKPVEALQKGVNIIRYSDGTTKKVYVK